MRPGAALLAAGAALCLAAAAAGGALSLMAGHAASPQPLPAADGRDGPAGEGPGRVDWEGWLSVNPDIVAWIEVPGAGISQPVVREDPEAAGFYLTHDVYGSWNLFGCPYVDAECEWPDGRAVYVLGHNISSPPAMFHALVDADLSGGAVLHTPDGPPRALSFLGRSVVRGDDPAKRVSFASDEEFEEWESGIPGAGRAGGAAQVIALCTCSYTVLPGNERTVAYFAAS